MALLSIVISAANAGKLLGCLKVDAAITNASAQCIGSTHGAAIIASVATAAALAVGTVLLSATDALPHTAQAVMSAIVIAFAGGSVQQAESMRMLRDDRLALFALVKALPSALLAIVSLWLGVEPIAAYSLAFIATVVLSWALHALPVPRDVASHLAAMWRALWAARSYVLQGAPAAALDAANLLLLSIVTITIAGGTVAGQATQLQRITLAPSLATSLLLSQHLWRQQLRDASERQRQSRYNRALALACGSAILSVVLLAVTISTPLRQVAAISGSANAAAVLSCLAPLLAQYASSPLTVYFFKCEQLTLYTVLQFLLLGFLTSIAVAATWLPLGHLLRAGLLIGYSAIVFVLTVSFSRLAVNQLRESA
jgi:hypothetical protein